MAKKKCTAKQLSALKKGREALKKQKATAKKTVRKELAETKKKVRKTTTKIVSNARKQVSKATTKAITATKKRLQKKGLAGVKKPRKIVCYWWNDKMNEFSQDFDSLAKAINHAKEMADLWNHHSTIFEFFDGKQHRQITVSKIS